MQVKNTMNSYSEPNFKAIEFRTKGKILRQNPRLREELSKLINQNADIAKFSKNFNGQIVCKLRKKFPWECAIDYPSWSEHELSAACYKITSKGIFRKKLIATSTDNADKAGNGFDNIIKTLGYYLSNIQSGKATVNNE